MENLLNYTREELSLWLEKNGVRPFRAGQVFKWLYLKLATDFEQMTDLGKDLRELLSGHFYFDCLTLADRQVSADTTTKYLFCLADGAYIESVLIPEKDHFTLCVSSQVGCAMNCRFCLTATCGFVRNLSAGEIIAQIRAARYFLAQKGIDPLKLSNIVFMGMGEPLANYDNVIQALQVIMDTDFGMKFSARKITVSTCGLVPGILDLGEASSVNLAISLNATDDRTRSWLMPVNNTYPLEQLLDACQNFAMKPRNKITFEYILIKGVNDSPGHARHLVRLLAPIRAKVNLIAFNPHPGSDLKQPDPNAVKAFLQILLDRHMTAIVRKSKGADILAACGQLRARHKDGKGD
ncbi:MAG: 23S rRNA (adenine(2503)-C(2))-methyltransferase RlmN [Desulfotignum sp.]|nr:23S rRNA (adenine(2503)-C(2))-methyltransferase RlmN [Desulfotignum sp.]MCF8126009.1 23S rRNA (adenine(2503)-C(2))-methyltransferase RlmN [Desulfotignum sp.]